MKQYKQFRKWKRVQVYLRKLLRYIGYSSELFLYFPHSISQSSYEKTLLDMRRKVRKGYSVQVIQWPQYIDNVPASCFYHRKQSKCQKCLKQLIQNDETSQKSYENFLSSFLQQVSDCSHSNYNHS